MKITKILGVVAAIAIAACLAGCGSSSSSDGGGGDVLTENQAIALSEQISGVAMNAMNNMDVNASVSQGLEVDAGKTVQCNTETGTCTYNIPLSWSQNCTAGGRIGVTGSITGTTTDGSGFLQIGATETITDWQCITGYIINGDPYISLSGTFSFLGGAPATQQSMTISGGFKWGTTAAESCQISLSINFSSDGGGTMTGTVCGYSVSASF
jgi:hypothetical protein